MIDGVPDWPLMDAALEIAETDDGAVVEDASRGRVHYINRTGAYILSLCDGATDIGAIVRHVQAEFVLAETPAELVRDLLSQFAAENVVTAGPGPRGLQHRCGR